MEGCVTNTRRDVTGGCELVRHDISHDVHAQNKRGGGWGEKGRRGVGEHGGDGADGNLRAPRPYAHVRWRAPLGCHPCGPSFLPSPLLPLPRPSSPPLFPHP